MHSRHVVGDDVVFRLESSAGVEGRLRIHKNRLRMSDVSSFDNGVFECSARNVAGTVNSSNSFVLSVAGQFCSLQAVNVNGIRNSRNECCLNECCLFDR